MTSDQPAWVDSARKIVREHQYEHVDTDGAIVPEGTPGAVLFDATSASLMLQVFDGVGESNRQKLCAMTFIQAHSVAMKIQERITKR